jgi:hypothetical protein
LEGDLARAQRKPMPMPSTTTSDHKVIKKIMTFSRISVDFGNFQVLVQAVHSRMLRASTLKAHTVDSGKVINHISQQQLLLNLDYFSASAANSAGQGFNCGHSK